MKEFIILFKKYIAENKYSQLKIITWKIYELMQVLMGNKNNNSNVSASFRSLKMKQNFNKAETIINNNNIFYGNIKEKYFYLVIQKATLNGKHVGYRFFFKRKEEDDLFSLDRSNKLKKKIMKNKTPKRVKVSFRAIKTENSGESTQKTEGVIYNSRTENRKFCIKMSKSLKNPKKEEKKIGENMDNTEDNNNVTNESDDIKNKSLEKTSSMKVKKDSLKKKPSRFASLNPNSERVYNSIQNLKFVEQNFVPKCSFSFSLDIESMAFRPCFNTFKSDKTINFFKNEAIDKIKQYQIMKKNIKKRQISFSSEDSSYEQTESNEEESNLSSEYSSSSYDNNKNLKQKKTLKPNAKEKKEDNNDKEKNIKTEIEGNYYRVEVLNKIKYMIYDFDQEMIIDKGINKDIKSEVENIIMNYFHLNLNSFPSFLPYLNAQK